MILSNACKYGIRALIFLALTDNKHKNIGIKTIAKKLDIPTPFLSKILQNLAKHNILLSTKGPHGGFQLAKDPKTIKMIDIVLIIDGDDVFETCLISLKSCNTRDHNHKPCPVHKKFLPIQKQLISLFTNESISNLAEDIEAGNIIEI